MTKRTITNASLTEFSNHLQTTEKSKNTQDKYLRDIRAFCACAGGREITKERVIAYKNRLIAEGYAPRSINSMLASLNSLFAFLGWTELKVRGIRLQRQIYCAEDRELSKADYTRLLRTAQRQGNLRLELLLQTICGTGIRVSELPYITVEAVRRGVATVSLKGKTRTVWIVKSLQKKLLRYISEQKLRSGPVFITRSGKPMNRTSIWREMKNLCQAAGVLPQKVFPHNLRHLFARTFYRMEKDVVRLADVLGHSSINTTRLYILTPGNEHRRTMERLHLIL